MSRPILLDEMFSDRIAQRLRARSHDVIAVVADSALVSLPDDQVLAYATAEGSALVTARIKDFIPLDGIDPAAGHAHAASFSSRPGLSRRTGRSPTRSPLRSRLSSMLPPRSSPAR